MYHSVGRAPAGRTRRRRRRRGGGRLRAQIYSPPYLFKGPRPTIVAAPGTAAYGIELRHHQSGGRVHHVGRRLMRPTAATHALDMNQRYVPLAFTRLRDDASRRPHRRRRRGAAGRLHARRQELAGVPSVASWIRIGTAGSAAARDRSPGPSPMLRRPAPDRRGDGLDQRAIGHDRRDRPLHPHRRPGRRGAGDVPGGGLRDE